MEKDTVFAGKKENISPFEFNEQVTRVFDDMLNRSVPLYGESILRQAQLTCEYYQKGTRIYDLGCSHGNLGIRIIEQMGNTPFSMVGVDSSMPMVEKYTKRLKTRFAGNLVELICGKMENILIENASVVLINLTLQFLDPEKRDDLIHQIYKGMVPGGILILTEKTILEQKTLNKIQEKFYKQFKLENGYSELEISQKRDALEKVLIPDTIAAHEKRFEKAGFENTMVWLKWFNFTSMIAVK